MVVYVRTLYLPVNILNKIMVACILRQLVLIASCGSDLSFTLHIIITLDVEILSLLLFLNLGNSNIKLGNLSILSVNRDHINPLIICYFHL